MRRPTWTVILAAGAGRRMGGAAKALLPFRGRTFLETIAAAAREGGADGLVVVVGHHRDDVEPLARDLADAVAVNHAPERGMSSSVRCGARAVPEGAAMLVWPVDVPAVRPATVRLVLAAGREHPEAVVVPTFEGDRGGHPTLLPPRVVAAARAMGDDDRLDHVAARSPLRRIAVGDPAVGMDVDVPGDLAALPKGTPGSLATD